MDKVNSIMQMEEYMMANGTKDKWKVKENYFILQENQHTKDNSKITVLMEKELFTTKNQELSFNNLIIIILTKLKTIGNNMKEHFKKILKKVLERLLQ